MSCPEELGGMAFMFDAAHESTLVGHEVGPYKLFLETIDEERGAMISGHYVWPGAKVLAEYLLSLPLPLPPTLNVVELGAGCGLTSLVLYKMFVEASSTSTSTSTSTSVLNLSMTDYDPGVLQKAQKNYDLNKTHHCSSLVTNISCDLLEWGVDFNFSESFPKLSTPTSSPTLNLVIGSDVIYSVEVVEPLMKTISLLLTNLERSTHQTQTQTQSQNTTRMIMSQSFAYDSAIENMLNDCCVKFDLFRSIISDTFVKGSTNNENNHKIQMFTVVPKINSIWEHFKSTPDKEMKYKVVEIARCSETQERKIVYKALYGERGVWVRDLSMWLEKVVVDGVEKNRFNLIELPPS